MKRFGWLLWLIFISLGCGQIPGIGDKKDENLAEKLGNSDLLLNYSGSLAFTGTGLTLKGLKVWRARHNSHHPGTVDDAGAVTVEVWYSLEGDDAVVGTKINADGDTPYKHRYSKSIGWQIDAEGNLYHPSYVPGSKVYVEPSTLNNEGIYEYIITKTDGLLVAEFPVFGSYQQLGSSTSGSRTNFTRLKAHEIDTTGWSTLRYRQGAFPIITGRTRYQSNEDFSIKGRMGCLYQKATGGNWESAAYHFSDIEVGNLIQHSSGAITSANVDDANTVGDDDKLWIKWSESYYFSGINVATGKVRVYRHRAAPLFANRERVGVDGSDTSPKTSHLDALVRDCNQKAATGGKFRMVYLGSSLSALSGMNIDTSNSYCSSIDGAEASTIATTNTSFGCGFSITGLVAGTYDGSGSHSGPITSTGSTLYHHEVSNIVELGL